MKNLAIGLCMGGVVLASAITACSSGNNSNASYVSLSVPATTYQDAASTKFAVYTSAGGGKQTLTEIDTGSDLYVIE